jgi:FAD binding domain
MKRTQCDSNTPFLAKVGLGAAIQRVTGLDLVIGQPHWLSRATDNSRLVERYRDRRILLAGDAAHVHWAYGGMGLQTGLQDAYNLGWKLAAQAQGWAPEGLLDTYHSERHPVGERLPMSTRAQEALARPGNHVTALRQLFGELLKQPETYRYIVEMVTSVEIRYDMGGGATNHPLVGRFAPDLALRGVNGGTRVAEFMRRGRGVFLELVPREDLRATAARWETRIDMVAARSDRRPTADALLIRPDGYVAWAAGSGGSEEESLAAALAKWFGVGR